MTGSWRYCGYIQFDVVNAAHLIILAQAQACCLLQGKKVHKSRIDIYALFKPLFQGVAKDKPDCLVRVESKVCTHSAVQHMQLYKPQDIGDML